MPLCVMKLGRFRSVVQKIRPKGIIQLDMDLFWFRLLLCLLQRIKEFSPQFFYRSVFRYKTFFIVSISYLKLGIIAKN